MVEISTSTPLTSAKWRVRLFYLAVAAAITLAVFGMRLILASRIDSCGWRDGCFYYALARSLADHHGFTVPFVWNYQVGNVALPNPALEYWRPGMSLILALPSLFGHGVTLLSAAVMNAVATVLLSLSAAWLAWRTIGDRLAALLAYAVCLTLAPLWILPLTPDSALFYAVAVAWFLALVPVERRGLAVELLGVALVGVAYFIRNDAIVLGAVLAGIVAARFAQARGGELHGEIRRALVLAAAFVLALLPTHVLLAAVNGHFLNSAINRVIFLQGLDDFRHYGSPVDFATWSHAGLAALIKVRLDALFAVAHDLWLMCGQLPTLLIVLGAAIVATRRRHEYGDRFFGAALFLVALAGAYILVLPVIADHAVPRSAAALLPAFAVLMVIAVREFTTSPRTVSAVIGVVALVSVVHGLSVADGLLGFFNARRSHYLAEAQLMEGDSGKGRHLVAMVVDPAPFTATTGIPSVPLPSNGIAAVRQAIARYGVTDVVESEWKGGRTLVQALHAGGVVGVPGTTEIVIPVPPQQAAGAQTAVTASR